MPISLQVPITDIFSNYPPHRHLLMGLTQCWDAAADFYVACGFRQNTAIRFTDSGWGSKSRFFDVQKKPFFDVFFIENESFFAILYYFFTETAFKIVFLKCLNPSGIVSSFLKWV